MFHNHIYIYTSTVINEWVHLNLGTYCSAIGTLFLSILLVCEKYFVIRWVFMSCFHHRFFPTTIYIVCQSLLYILALNVENILFFNKITPTRDSVCVPSNGNCVYFGSHFFCISTTRNAYYINKWNDSAININVWSECILRHVNSNEIIFSLFHFT